MRKNILILSVLVFAFLLILLPQEAFGRRTRETDTIARIQAVVRAIQAQGTEVWVDTAEPALVKKAVELGATGGTSNPTLITDAIRKTPEVYNERILELAGKYLKGPRYYTAILSDIERTQVRLGIEGDPLAKAILLELTGDLIGTALERFSGPMSWEIDPRFHNDARAMVEETELLYEIAEARNLDLNRIYIKIPATEAGLKATEILISEGVNVNLTLVFSIAQALEGLRRFETGIEKAEERGLEADKIYMCISPFLGRWDAFLAKQGLKVVDSDDNPVAGLYFAKLLHQRYLQEIEQGGYSFPNRPQIIMASIRSINHVQQLIGADIMTIPPEVLLSPAFAGIDASEKTIDKLYFDRTALQSLVDISARDEWYRKSLQLDGMSISDFGQHPLVQEGNAKFIQPYEELLKLIEETLLSSSMP